jgi:hypothetical protein
MSTAIRKLIPHIPTPSRDHRQNETTTLLEQHRVEARIALADLVGHMSNVELDRASAARLEVDEEQAVPRTKQVAGMRLAVQQRVGAHLAANCLPPTAQRVEEQRPISIKERRRVVSIRQESLSGCDSFCEVWCFDLDALHRHMHAIQSVGVLRRRGRVSRRVVVSPVGHGKVITLIHTRFHPGVERRDRGGDRAQALRDQHFERCDFLADNRSSGEHVTRQEAETESVGVLYNDHILHMQVEVAPEGRSRSGCTRYEPCLHNVHPDMWVRSSADPGIYGRSMGALDEIDASALAAV